MSVNDCVSVPFEAASHRVPRSFESTCAHLSAEELREELAQALRVNAELIEDCNSLMLQVEDLIDEVNETRAGYPRGSVL